MSKHHPQHQKTHATNHVRTSVSVDPETPPQFQDGMGSMQSSGESGFAPSYEDIQRRAYQLHEEKGGSDLENWLEAEQILKQERR